jgi:hypothetical protein
MKLKKLFTALTFSAVSVISASAFDVTFVSTTGKVEFQDGGIWVKAQKGDVVEQGTVISTGYKSSAVIRSQNSTFTIGPMTRITLEKLTKQDGRENTQLFIDSGSIQSDVKSGNKFKVRSAVATASVRGTSFKFLSSGRLHVTKGLVALSPAESKRAEIAEKISDSVQNKDPEQPETKTSIFTSTAEVGEVKGVPVYENQASTLNAAGTSFSSPAQEKSKEVTILTSSTTKASETEAASTASAASGIIQGTNSTPESTSVTFTVSIED